MLSKSDCIPVTAKLTSNLSIMWTQEKREENYLLNTRILTTKSSLLAIIEYKVFTDFYGFFFPTFS